jgi:peroxiredoxin
MVQNPSLALAISPDAAKEMAEHTRIEKLPDITIDGDKTAYQALKINSQGNGPGVMTFLIDPSSHLIRQVRFDITDALKQRGAVVVKKALLTVDYTTTTPDATMKADQFAWTPPQGAKDARQAKAEAQGDEKDSSSELEGKPAPDFKLTGLDGKDVALADLKGSVVIVDFWATWCGPCVQSLPHLNKVYEDNKAAGLKVFALDLREAKDKVQAFVDKKKLTIPVLLDSDGKVAEAYKVSGIPQTVIIGKDGAVRKVFVGFGGDESEQALRDEVAAAMKAQ